MPRPTRPKPEDPKFAYHPCRRPDCRGRVKFKRRVGASLGRCETCKRLHGLVVWVR